MACIVCERKWKDGGKRMRDLIIGVFTRHLQIPGSTGIPHYKIFNYFVRSQSENHVDVRVLMCDQRHDAIPGGSSGDPPLTAGGDCRIPPSTRLIIAGNVCCVLMYRSVDECVNIDRH